MEYIEILLQNPGKKINIYKLQEVAGSAVSTGEEEPYNDNSSEGVAEGYYDPSGKEAPKLGINAWQSSDDKAVQEYKVELGKLEEQLEAERSKDIQNRSKIKRFEKDIRVIKQHIDEASYKPKDPEAEKNRKRVLSCITYSINKIGKLEKLAEYHDRPLSRHLSRNIRTGFLCSYCIKEGDLPLWKFAN